MSDKGQYGQFHFTGQWQFLTNHNHNQLINKNKLLASLFLVNIIIFLVNIILC